MDTFYTKNLMRPLNPEDTETHPPVDVTKSDLLGKILEGISGVSGYPITKQAEDSLVQTPPPIPLIEKSPVESSTRQPATERKTVKPKMDTPAVPTSRAKPVDLMASQDSVAPVEPESQGETPAPQAAPKTVEVPKPEVDQELIDAQTARRDELKRLAIADGVAQILHGLTRSTQPYNENNFANARQLAGLGLEDLKERRALARQKKLDTREEEKFNLEKEKDTLGLEKLKAAMEDEKQRKDPNSLASQAVREFQKQRFETLSKASNGGIKFDPKAFDSMSAEQLESTFGKFSPENIANALMQNERLKQEAALRREDRKEARKEKDEKRQEDLANKKRNELDAYIQKTQKDLDKQVGTIQKGRTDLAMVESALKNPSAVKDTGALYSLVKGFDPDSAVREGELVLANKGQSYADQIKTAFSRLRANDTRMLQPNYLKQILDYTREVQALREKQYRDKMDKRINYAQERLGLPSEQKEFIDPLYDEQQVTRQPQAEQFSPSEEAGINAVMAKNPGATRQQVIDALRSQGKIK